MERAQRESSLRAKSESGERKITQRESREIAVTVHTVHRESAVKDRSRRERAVREQ